jgi:glycosyltransferase involved in cell wall biosynthesis
LYCRKASQLFPMSNFILDENRKYLGLAFPGAIVTHTVPGPQFHPIADAEILGDVRARYRLPERIILNPTRVDHPGLDHSDSFYGGKNPETALRAFAMCREEIPHDLVFAGRRVREYFLHLGFAGKDFDRVHFVGCVSRDDLAALYNLADLTVIPSFYEGCPANVMQALACGCPVLASCTGGSREVCGGAGLLADPHNTADFASKMRAVLTDPELKARLVSDGLERAKFFDWSRTATLTLDGLTRAALGHRWQESEKAVRDLGIHHR